MTKLDLDALQAKAAALAGKAPHVAGDDLRPGAVFEVEDGFVWFRDATMHVARTDHAQRRVIVVPLR